MNTRWWVFATRARSRSVRLLACTVAAVLALLVASASAAAHGPDPIFSGRWNQNQNIPFSWRSGSVPGTAYQAAIRAAAADASATRGSQAATFTYSAGASNLIGYGSGATCSTLGIACFTRNPPSSFTMWMREQGHVFDWGSLRWCQAYTTSPNGCFDVENIILDEFGHVEILNHHATFDSESDYLDAVGTGHVTRETKGRLERARLRTVRRGQPPAPVRHAELGRQVLDLPEPGHDPGPDGEPDVDRQGRHHDADRHAQGRRRCGLRPARPQPGRLEDRHAPTTPRRDHVVDDRRDDGQRLDVGHLHAVAEPAGSDGVPGGVQPSPPTKVCWRPRPRSSSWRSTAGRSARCRPVSDVRSDTGSRSRSTSRPMKGMAVPAHRSASRAALAAGRRRSPLRRLQRPARRRRGALRGRLGHRGERRNEPTRIADRAVDGGPAVVLPSVEPSVEPLSFARRSSRRCPSRRPPRSSSTAAIRSSATSGRLPGRTAAQMRHGCQVPGCTSGQASS